MPEENFEVRDLRHQEWLWTSKNLLFHTKVDEKMYKVYSGLAAYANNQTQKAFPSIGTLMEKLHMGRNTIIRALQKLERGAFIFVEREKGANNVYSLLEFEADQKVIPKAKSEILEKPTIPAPAQNTKTFFKGIQDLRNKVVETGESQQVKLFLLSLTEKYPKANKAIIWGEIQKFERYWTELNSTGTKERWQTEKTFQIDRRLVTWFAKKKEFATGNINSGKGNKVIA
jgi:hypothetical protein